DRVRLERGRIGDRDPRGPGGLPHAHADLAGDERDGAAVVVAVVVVARRVVEVVLELPAADQVRLVRGIPERRARRIVDRRVAIDRLIDRRAIDRRWLLADAGVREAARQPTVAPAVRTARIHEAAEPCGLADALLAAAQAVGLDAAWIRGALEAAGGD